MTKLLPCPFCGEAEELYPAHHGMGGGAPYAIDCLGCGFDFVPREGMDVIAMWNRRAPDASAPALLETLRRLDAFIDFGEPLEPGEWGIDDPSFINEAFQQARAAISQATVSIGGEGSSRLGPKDGAGNHGSAVASGDAGDAAALRYAQQLATYAAQKWGPPEGWQPLPDLMGVLTQLDNMLAGMERKQ